MSSTSISGASSQVYLNNKEIETKPEDSKIQQKLGNDEGVITKQKEYKAEVPVEQNKTTNFSKSNSEPKLLDFGIFDYKQETLTKQQSEMLKSSKLSNISDTLESQAQAMESIINKIQK